MASAGLVCAALCICQISVARDIPAVTIRARAKIHQETGALLAKFSRYFVIDNPKRRMAIIKIIPVSVICKSSKAYVEAIIDR